MFFFTVQQFRIQIVNLIIFSRHTIISSRIVCHLKRLIYLFTNITAKIVSNINEVNCRHQFNLSSVLMRGNNNYEKIAEINLHMCTWLEFLSCVCVCTRCVLSYVCERVLTFIRSTCRNVHKIYTSDFNRCVKFEELCHVMD